MLIKLALFFAFSVSASAQCGLFAINPITGKLDCIGSAVSGGAAVNTGTAAVPIYTVPVGTVAVISQTLTTNVTSSTLTGSLSTGQIVCFRLTQDGTGGWTYAYPTNVLSFTTPDTTASAVTTQCGIYDATNVNASSAAIVTGLGGQGQGFTCVEGTAPASPAALSLKLYCNSTDETVRVRNSAGKEFVIGGGNVLEKTANYTITAADLTAKRSFSVPTGAAEFTFTLPASTSANADGDYVDICSFNTSNDVVINRNGKTINALTAALSIPPAYNAYRTQCAKFKVDSTGNYIIQSSYHTQTKDCTGTGHVLSINSDNSVTCGTDGGAPLFTQTASASAVTSNTETTVIGTGAGSLTIPAAWFAAAGYVLDVCFGGLISTAAVPGTVQFKLYFGATSVAQTAAFTPLVSVTAGTYQACARLTARTVGASGTIMVNDILTMTGATLTPGEAAFANPTPGTAVVVDTTATQAVQLKVTFSLDAINSATGTNFYMSGRGR